MYSLLEVHDLRSSADPVHDFSENIHRQKVQSLLQIL